MTREERELRREQEERLRSLENAAREAGRGPIDVPFLLLAMLLTGIGLIMLFSVSFPSAYYKTGNAAYYFMRQAAFAGIGVAAMLVTGRINYERFRPLAKYVLFLSILLLIVVLIPGVGTGRETHGAQRWIKAIGPLPQFQPSELVKLGIILFFADSISRKKDKMRTFRYGILPYGVILVIIAGLMMLEPHLSGTVLMLGIGASMLFVGGIRPGWIAAGAGGAGAFLWVLLSGKIKYNSMRISVWRDPLNTDILDKGFQIRQGLLAIGSGGLLGVGLGQSRQKYLYLPEPQNDFIFSIICEELGLIGAALILALFALLILRGYWIALHARDRFGALLAVGITTQIALQVFLNVAVVTNLIPNTGISLPFFSYGGTALAIQLVEIGIMLSVSRQMPPD